MMSAHGWRTVPLREIAPEVRGSAVLAAGTGYELWSVPSFSHGRPEEVDGADVGSAKRPVEPNDVLICKINPRINRVWKVGPYRGRPQFASPEWITVRPGAVGEVDPDFLRLYLSSPRFRDWIVGEVSGVTGSHTRAKPAQVMAWLVPVPPLPEQRRIVEILEGHLSRLDAGVRLLATSEKRLDSLRVSALSHAVAEALADSETETRTVGDLALVGSGTTPARSERAFYDGGTVPWVTSGDLRQGLITSAKQFVTSKAVAATSLSLYPPGTLLVAMYGEGKTRGSVAELGIAATTNQACAAIQLRDPSQKAWVRAVLEAKYQTMRRMAAGGVQNNLNLGLVRSISVPVPSPETAERLLAQLEVSLESLGPTGRELAQAHRRAGALRRSALNAAFAGHLTGLPDTKITEELTK